MAAYVRAGVSSVTACTGASHAPGIFCVLFCFVFVLCVFTCVWEHLPLLFACLFLWWRGVCPLCTVCGGGGVCRCVAAVSSAPISKSDSIITFITFSVVGMILLLLLHALLFRVLLPSVELRKVAKDNKWCVVHSGWSMVV